MRTVILGIGNLLLGDEGVGVHAARTLQDKSLLPTNTEVLEVGTAILDALPALETAERIIIMDAMQADHPPGTTYRIPLADCSGAPCIASMHGIDIYRVLSLTGRTDVPEVVVFGIEPAHLDWSLELSPVVAAALPGMLRAVGDEIRDGVPAEG